MVYDLGDVFLGYLYFQNLKNVIGLIFPCGLRKDHPSRTSWNTSELYLRFLPRSEYSLPVFSFLICKTMHESL